METLKLPSFKKISFRNTILCGQTDEVELLEVAYNVHHREHLRVSDNMVFGDFMFTSYERGKDNLEHWLGE